MYIHLKFRICSINFDLVFSELSLLISGNTSLSKIIYVAKGSDEEENEGENLTGVWEGG